MSRASIATPCPAPYGLSSLPILANGRRTSTASVTSTLDDTTANLDYTRELQLEFQNVKPRRKSTFQKRDRKDAAVTIFEDVLEDEELVVQSKKEIGGSTLLGRPAQRIPGQARKEPQGMNSSMVRGQRTGDPSQAIIREDTAKAPVRAQGDVKGAIKEAKTKGGLKKEPRRRTIFVPTEDTTILTIHPGANTTDRLNDTFQLLNFAPQQPAVEQRSSKEQHTTSFQPGKRPRMSLAVAPKRMPLQQLAAQESNSPGLDRAGQNGGKENFPPRSTVCVEEKKANQKLNPQAARHSLAGSKLFEPTAASYARQAVLSRNAVPLRNVPCDVQNLRPIPAYASPQARKQQREKHAHVSLRPLLLRPDEHAGTRRQSVQVAFKEPSPPQRPRPTERRVEAKTARLQQYPVLVENIAQPELYEDSWLSHQEVALTELVNSVFSSADSVGREQNVQNASFRERLIEIYHQPEVTTLHRRLQASLHCGALSRPKDVSSPPNPAQDIGLRKRFLSLWLDSYDLESLRVAAEVVFGRQLPTSMESKNLAGEGDLDPHKKRRSVIRFLETFMVEVDDVEEPDKERGDDSNSRWRKMVLRSLMLIWLLDKAKTSQAVQGCLFKPTSYRKSSVTMLHSLSSMLIPSIGEITRVLRHLDYEVSHIQDPLDEVKYRIENMATDLRDGILLTRLTEILLFAPTRKRAAKTTCDGTVTIQMPDLTILESVLDAECPRILSQHLKMPCLGRTQKTYNVQIAISALRDYGRLGEVVLDVTADDVVDGHRERTLGLLWSLVSIYGLEHLLDFKELALDIRRASAGTLDAQALLEDSDSLSQSQQESLLKKWASAYCVRQGIRVGNLTTSFADGRAYAAILDAFEEYADTKASTGPGSSPNNTRLEAQLQGFGCSNAFIKQICSNSGTIPSRKTTISNLAFLASRLLPLVRQHNAAQRIQRVFRLKRARMIASQRISLMRVAHACATVVQTQKRLVSAATVLQKAWRNVLDARIKRLNSGVEDFQAIAKAWLVRRHGKQGGPRGW